MAYVLHLSVARLALVAFCAALLVTEHVRLAFAARKHAGRRAFALALLVPGAGAVMAWRRGWRFAPVLVALAALGYVLGRCV